MQGASPLAAKSLKSPGCGLQPCLRRSGKACYQERCRDPCRAAGDEGAYRASLEHLDIIARLGRFPYRNAVLWRTTTAEEQAFLDAGGFAMQMSLGCAFIA